MKTLKQFANLRYLTVPSFKKKQIVTTERNKGHEDQPFVDLIIFCSKSLFLAGVLLFLGLATSVQAQYTYVTNNGSITITGYTGSGGMVTIPGMIDGLAVTDIGTNAFQGTNIFSGRDMLSGLTSVIIPDSVTNIGNEAFYDCSQLTNVTFGDSITSIGNSAFSGQYGGVYFGFISCPLTTVTIPSSVTNIGIAAFEGCPLSNVTIPNSVTSIGDYAFFACQALTNVTMAEGLASIGAYAFSGLISNDSFGPPPLGACPLTGITIPDSLTNIGVGAFARCFLLTNITFGVGLTTIGAYAFENCGLTKSVTIPDSLTNIGVLAFEACGSLTAINVAPGNPAYSSVAGVLFNLNQTTLLEYPSGLGGSYAIPAGVTTIGPAAFEGCAELTNITLSLGTTDIESNAFELSGLSRVTIPNSVMHIGEYAFYNCFNLTNITFPGTVTNIGDYAFQLCGNLTSAYFLGNAPDADSTVFSHPLSAYYLPGTKGWAEFTTNTGVPTALWTLPYPLILNGSSGVLNNQFGFTISWATNVPVVVEASTGLSNPAWAPIATNTLSSGTSYFSDPNWTNYPNRFYRLRSQ